MICADDPDALAVFQALPADVKAHTVVYGTTPIEQLPDLGGAAHVWISSEQETAGTGVERLTLHLPAAVTSADAVAQRVELKVPGIHNARNAAAAITAAVLLGVSPTDAAQAVGTFLGAARRFQVHGTVKQVTVVDDYAHHPTEIAALLDAARRRYPQSTIRVISSLICSPVPSSLRANSPRRWPRPMMSSSPAFSLPVRSRRTSRRLPRPPSWMLLPASRMRLPASGFNRLKTWVLPPG